MDEMHHAEWLIQRIIFFEGVPIVSRLNPMKIGKSVLEMVTARQADELDAIHAYNAAIRLAQEVDDQATADLLRKILLMEEGHVDWAEQQSDQIEQMGLAIYLSQPNSRRSRLDRKYRRERSKFCGTHLFSCY